MFKMQPNLNNEIYFCIYQLGKKYVIMTLMPVFAVKLMYIYLSNSVYKT